MWVIINWTTGNKIHKEILIKIWYIAFKNMYLKCHLQDVSHFVWVSVSYGNYSSVSSLSVSTAKTLPLGSAPTITETGNSDGTKLSGNYQVGFPGHELLWWYSSRNKIGLNTIIKQQHRATSWTWNKFTHKTEHSWELNGHIYNLLFI